VLRLSFDVVANCICFCLEPTVLSRFRDHLGKGLLPAYIIGTVAQCRDQIDGNERIVVIDESDPLLRARRGTCSALHHELEPAGVGRFRNPYSAVRRAFDDHPSVRSQFGSRVAASGCHPWVMHLVKACGLRLGASARSCDSGRTCISAAGLSGNRKRRVRRPLSRAERTLIPCRWSRRDLAFCLKLPVGVRRLARERWGRSVFYRRSRRSLPQRRLL
jgi:hypothetical protein